MFPTEFPAAQAKKIGNAILTRTFDRTLVEPAYDVVGYGLYLTVGSDAPFPRPPVAFSTAPLPPLEGDDIARRLIETADLGPDGDGAGVRAMPIPWRQVIEMLCSLIQGVLAGEATR